MDRLSAMARGVRSIQRAAHAAMLAVMVVAVSVVLFSSVAQAQSVRVRGYYRSNGTYIMPHWRSAPDHSVWNNWSTQGNINPYTGVLGTRSPWDIYSSSRRSSYRHSYSSYPGSSVSGYGSGVYTPSRRALTGSLTDYDRFYSQHRDYDDSGDD